MDRMYKALVNDHGYEIKTEGRSWTIDEKAMDLDIAQLSEGIFHVLWNNKGYRVSIEKPEGGQKTFMVAIGENRYSVTLKDERDQLLEKMGFQAATDIGEGQVKAPMPGLIMDLKVKEGDMVKQGDPLLVLEAMKMENTLKSPRDGTIKAIYVRQGDRVEKNQRLLEY